MLSCRTQESHWCVVPQEGGTVILSRRSRHPRTVPADDCCANAFRLPHSGFKVFYSTKYFRLRNDEDPVAVLPDIEVGLGAQECFTGEDPVLEAALRAR